MPLDRQDFSKDHKVDTSAAEEKTLAGAAIGGVWDLIAGKAKTVEARTARAHEADQFAEIAADTVAAIPKFKSVAGGLARGVLLADVSGKRSLGDWSANFAANVAEGALLNQAGKLAVSDGAVSQFLSKKLGNGLVSELAMHGLSGAAFGAVKGGFAIDGARDGQGNFSGTKYFENLAVNTSVGGLIGMPAGVFGSRVGKVVSSRIGETAEASLLSHTVRQSLTAGSSGFAGGAVFGGVDAMRDAKSVSDVLAGTLKGGAIGFFTAGATGAFEPRLAIRSDALRTPVVEAVPSGRETSTLSYEASPAGKRRDSERMQRDRYLDKLHGEDQIHEGFYGRENTSEIQTAVVAKPAINFESLSFKPKEVLISDFAPALKLARTEDREFRRVPGEATMTHEQLLARIEAVKAEHGKYDFTEYFHHISVPEVVKVHVYDVQGLSAKIVVPAEYAAKLEEVRQLRLLNDRATPYDLIPLADKIAIAPRLNNGDATVLEPYLTQAQITESIPSIQAGLALVKHPLAHRALPEDMVPILQSLPNPRLIKEIVLLDHPDYTNSYYRAKYGDPSFKAAADVTQQGVVTHYEGKRGTKLLDYTYHEWSHLTKWASPEISKLFDMATIVDKVGPNFDYKATREARQTNPDHETVVSNMIYYSREHATRTADENWAVAKGELFMSPDADGLWVFAHEAPVRALALSTALEASYGQRKNAPRTEQDKIFLDRMKYVDEVSRPLAIDALSTHALNGSVEQRSTAVKLLALYGDESSIPLLRKVAQDPKNSVKPDWEKFDGSINPVRENPTARVETPVTVASSAVEAMVKLSGKTDIERAHFALKEGMANPTLRELIVKNWTKFDAQHPEYGQFLEYYDRPSHLNPLQKLIETRLAHDADGRKMVLDEIMRLTDGDSRSQTGYLLRNYEHVPGLRMEVLNRFETMLNNGKLNAMDRSRAQNFFEQLNRGAMSPLVAKRIDTVLERMAQEQKVEAALNALNRPGSAKLDGIKELAAARDQRAIKPLLEQAISGSPESQSEALRALHNFSPNLVKFQAQAMKREQNANPVMLRRIEQLLTSHSYVSGTARPSTSSNSNKGS